MYALLTGFARYAPALQPVREMPEVPLQALTVVLPCLSVHSRCGIALEAEVSPPEAVEVVDVVPERRKS